MKTDERFEYIDGRRLRKLRRHMGMSQDDLAAKSSMSKGRISAIEQRGIGGVTFDTLANLMKAFNMKLDELRAELGGPGEFVFLRLPVPSDVYRELSRVATERDIDPFVLAARLIEAGLKDQAGIIFPSGSARPADTPADKTLQSTGPKE